MHADILICTHGDGRWEDLARHVAYPSALNQHERYCHGSVITLHNRRSTLAEIRNEAAEMSKASFIVFLDADDQLAPGYLDAMSLAWMNGAIFNDWNPLLAPYVSFNEVPPVIPNEGRWPQLNTCVIGTMVNRKLFLDVGGFKEWPSCEDYDLWLRCVAAGAQIVHVPEAIYRVSLSGRGRNRDQSCVPLIRAQTDVRAVFA